jgi:hypothetical protein
VRHGCLHLLTFAVARTSAQVRTLVLPSTWAAAGHSIGCAWGTEVVAARVVDIRSCFVKNSSRSTRNSSQ